MVARATVAEIDAVRMSVGQAVELFEESVVPALREQEGYEGAYVLLSDEGKALVLTFWETGEAAEAGLAGVRSFYDLQVEKFVTIFRSPPGRELFGIPVGTLAVLLLGLLAVAVAGIGMLALRNPVFFRLGVRSVTRRPGRSALIVAGLM